jgi:hypothetical protein
MTAPQPPLPASGGSYIRQPDGKLVPAEAAPAPATAPAPVKPTVKGALKTPVQED